MSSMTREEVKRLVKANTYGPMNGAGRSRAADKRAQSAEIELLTRDFLANGGEIQREEVREGKQVDLTWRNYAGTAMEGAEHEADTD
ncbi:hypothetical protein NLU14_08690 [Marinobacter sp. 71-i]|uniref:Uncharacterized protein n=1 Tax=Marinobacter iranensis TaxID=2962607 RepID=A0ABT5Y9E9_9GAMM|nr:hypothetical protein [Marinobacter iranensis]MDF0750306.1 hypothetical protein [Marinobacter iranensis]